MSPLALRWIGSERLTVQRGFGFESVAQLLSPW
jgi:hypothetical protein